MAQTDPFPREGLESPAARAEEITPSDSVDLQGVTRGIYIGESGDLAVKMKAGNDITFAAVPAGTLLPIRARRILSTGTTADSIVVLY